MITTTKQLNELKKLAGLNIPEEASNLETALIIAQFANTVFSHNGDNQPSTSDPITILKEAKAGSQFRCVEYSHLAAWLMCSYGINARTVNIMRKDVETAEYGAGHVVVEFYEGKEHGWVMADIQAGVMARNNEVLQSLLELRETLTSSTAENFDGTEFTEPEGMFGGNYKVWLRPYLYFLDRPQQLNYEYSIDDKPHFILVPEGDKPPKFFQITHKLELIETTPELFYKLTE